MASPNSVKILDVFKVAAAYDSTKSATETKLFLTFFEMACLRFPPTQNLCFFKLTDPNPTFFYSVIFPKLKQSLSHTLLHFLPIVGSLTWPLSSSKPFFVYHPKNDAVSLALAESTDDFDRLTGNGIREAVESHPYAPKIVGTENRSPLFALQVTLFPTKGYCIGFTTDHIIFDGVSATVFLRAWAYTCKYIVQKGDAPALLPEEINPSFDWTSIKDTEGLEEVFLKMWKSIMEKQPAEAGSDSNLGSVPPLAKLEGQTNFLRANFLLTNEDIKKLRESVLRFHPEATSSDPTKRINLSLYVLACSYTTTCLVKARGGDTNQEICFMWSADCRPRLDPPLPPNHFGNVTALHYIVGKAGDFMQEHGVAIIARKLSDSIKRTKKGVLDRSKERIAKLVSLTAGPEVQTMCVAGSTGFGFYNMDFGWGKVDKFEFTSIDTTGTFSILSNGNGNDRIIEIGVALTRPEMEAFASIFSNGLQVIHSKQVLLKGYL